ncbi:MAG TPA: zinc metallopeptidase [Anaerolineae bacterium]|nr:zinc metallopeptidase [Caldilineae bacterium]HID34176.1 zinc metallopeptidase [Anaerolineae bacterium]HIQ12492.1 zinc metallopeptidase [Caldilineales bacterium]
MFYGSFSLWLLLALPGLLLGLWAQMKVKRAFGKYSKVRNTRGLTGAQVARLILDHYGLRHVSIEETQGMLTDHYDPRAKVLRLSPAVGRAPTIAAVGVAAHEAGHALQDADGYAPLKLRSAIVPAVQFGSWLGPLIIMAGFFLMALTGAADLGYTVAWFGLILFALTAVFAIITLPVEFNASARAKKELVALGILSSQEMKGVNETLNAAALTYVAAAIAAIGQVLYYVFLLSGRRR